MVRISEVDDDSDTVGYYSGDVDDYFSIIQLSDESVATILKLLKFQTLESQSQDIFFDRNGRMEDEFMEIRYYKDLVSIDKKHQTTSNGFKKRVKEENGDDGLYDLRLQIGADGNYRDHIFKSNPTTNDWIPLSGD